MVHSHVHGADWREREKLVLKTPTALNEREAQRQGQSENKRYEIKEPETALSHSAPITRLNV